MRFLKYFELYTNKPKSNIVFYFKENIFKEEQKKKSLIM